MPFVKVNIKDENEKLKREDLEFAKEYEKIEAEYNSLPTKKCLCGREYPDLPMYFNKDG